MDHEKSWSKTVMSQDARALQGVGVVPETVISLKPAAMGVKASPNSTIHEWLDAHSWVVLLIWREDFAIWIPQNNDIGVDLIKDPSWR